MVSMTVDIDIWDFLAELTRDETRKVYEELRIELGHDAEPEPAPYDLSDPVQRLEIISALRAEGYTVEPA